MIQPTRIMALVCALGALYSFPLHVHAKELHVGVDANYVLDMEKSGSQWKWNDSSMDIFSIIATNEVREFRVRLWTSDEGFNGKEYATQIVQRALKAGLNPYLVIFLSEDWADMMKQPIPTVWKDLSFEERLEAVRVYSRDVVRHFRHIGLQNHLYEIGNEIDYGICGEYPSKGGKKNPAALSRRLWPRSAEIIKASQQGVLEVDPNAKFMLHIAHWWDVEFCKAFFQFMMDQGVQLDYAGLSYFPSSNIGGSMEFEQLGDVVTALEAAIHRPIIIPETAYPSTANFKGQFARWKYEILGYPLTPDGQRRWIADMLAFCNTHPAIDSVYYWSPEWFGEGMWKAFALFGPTGESKPAWNSFHSTAWKNRALKKSVYLDVGDGQLFRVPVENAKQDMIQKVTALRKQTGGVNMEHLQLLDQTSLQVGAYDVRLKSSLQQNLFLERPAGAKGISLHGRPADLGPLLTKTFAGIQPTQETVVLIVRKNSEKEAEAVRAFLETQSISVILHPKENDAPLRLGMCGAFPDDTEE